ncbi:Conserved_hypothetical protein [Hexamita inflata]|uniref:Uncharacterized protein n=1 Tax=Hexamita inflata TaxID=28002 RepID=A0AA86U955_9EUKA|nr:Conserved hypothetical protein [Hexamita inflata]
MYEDLLGCDPNTDHDSPKDVFPLFQEFINTCEKDLSKAIYLNLSHLFQEAVIQILNAELLDKQQTECDKNKFDYKSQNQQHLLQGLEAMIDSNHGVISNYQKKWKIDDNIVAEQKKQLKAMSLLYQPDKYVEDALFQIRQQQKEDEEYVKLKQQNNSQDVIYMQIKEHKKEIEKLKFDLETKESEILQKHTMLQIKEKRIQDDERMQKLSEGEMERLRLKIKVLEELLAQPPKVVLSADTSEKDLKIQDLEDQLNFKSEEYSRLFTEYSKYQDEVRIQLDQANHQLGYQIKEIAKNAKEKQALFVKLNKAAAEQPPEQINKQTQTDPMIRTLDHFQEDSAKEDLEAKENAARKQRLEIASIQTMKNGLKKNSGSVLSQQFSQLSGYLPKSQTKLIMEHNSAANSTSVSPPANIQIKKNNLPILKVTDNQAIVDQPGNTIGSQKRSIDSSMETEILEIRRNIKNDSAHGDIPVVDPKYPGRLLMQAINSNQNETISVMQSGISNDGFDARMQSQTEMEKEIMKMIQSQQDKLDSDADMSISSRNSSAMKSRPPSGLNRSQTFVLSNKEDTKKELVKTDIDLKKSKILSEDEEQDDVDKLKTALKALALSSKQKDTDIDGLMNELKYAFKVRVDDVEAQILQNRKRDQKILAQLSEETVKDIKKNVKNNLKTAVTMVHPLISTRIKEQVKQDVELLQTSYQKLNNINEFAQELKQYCEKGVQVHSNSIMPQASLANLKSRLTSLRPMPSEINLEHLNTGPLTLNTEFDKFQQFVKAVVKAKPQLDFAKEYVQQRCQIKDVFSRLYQDASLIKTKMTQIRDIYQQNLCTEQKKKSNNIDPSKTMRITFEDQLLGNVKSVCVQFFEKIGEKFPIQVQPALVLNSGFDDDDVPEYQKKRGMLKSAFASKIGEVVRPKTSLNISKVIVGSDLDKI